MTSKSAGRLFPIILTDGNRASLQNCCFNLEQNGLPHSAWHKSGSSRDNLQVGQASKPHQSSSYAFLQKQTLSILAQPWRMATAYNPL